MKTTTGRTLARVLRPLRHLLLLLPLTAGSASAQYYGGLHFEAYPRAFPGADPFRGFFVTDTALDDRRQRYGLKLGYQATPGWAWVTHYAEYDRRDVVHGMARQYGLDAVRSVSWLDRLTLTGSAGITRLHAANGLYASLYPELGVLPGSRAVNAARVGLGVQVRLNQSMGLRFNVERYRGLNGAALGDLDADHLSLGVMLRF